MNDRINRALGRRDVLRGLTIGAIAAAATSVDLNWAKEHHGLWLEEEIARGRMPHLPPSATPAE